MRFNTKQFLHKVLEKRYKSKTTLHLSLDIGTEWVKALVFKLAPDGTQHILGVAKLRQKLTNMQKGAVSDIAGVVDVCDQALKQAEEEAGDLSDDCVIGIAGELVKGEVVKIRHERANPNAKIDVAELDAIVESSQRDAIKQVRESIRIESGIDDIEIKLTNAAITGIEIDSHKVVNPIGFQGKYVELSVFNAFAPLTAIGALETVAEELGLNLITIAAEPYAITQTLNDRSDEFSAIFVDVGGGTTDVAVIIKGGIMGTKEFALAGRAFTKRLAKMFDETLARAEEIKMDYSEGKVSEELAKKISNAFVPDAQVWLDGLALSLEDFKLEILPEKIYLSGGGSKLKEIQDAIRSDWHKKLPFAKPPRIINLSPKDISGVKDMTGKLDDPQDVTGIGLAKLASSILINEERTPLQDAMARAMKLIGE